MIMKPSKKKKKSLPLTTFKKSEWLTEVLQLTAFAKTNPESPENWWESVVSGQPAQRIIRPFYSDTGLFENGLMQLNIQTQSLQLYRIDWLYTYNPQSPYDKNLYNIGSLDEAIKKFSSVIQKWLAFAPPVNRLAFGAGLMHPVKGSSEGYKYISKYLNAVKLESDTSSDFIYQINRPRVSKVKDIKDLKINRISNWSVAMRKSFEFTLSGQTLPMQPTEKLLQSACLLKIDINTNPEATEDLPNNKVNFIFDELVSLGVEISEKGDIK